MKIDIQRKEPKTVLTKAGGFIGEFTHTLNPYAGCAFSCKYCYVRELPIQLYREQEWGSWIDIKDGAAEKLKAEIRKERKKGRTISIFMSSSTDPYQPIELKECVTRSLLEAMAEEPPDYLMVQTRSPFAARDIDLFLKLKDRILVSMTIETDQENVRKAFAPLAPSIPQRIKALKEIRDAGIKTQAAVSPLLPCSRNFPKTLLECADRVCIDTFFHGDGSGGKRTEKLGIRKIYEELSLEKWWGAAGYNAVFKLFQEAFPEGAVFALRDGFTP